MSDSDKRDDEHGAHDDHGHPAEPHAGEGVPTQPEPSDVEHAPTTDHPAVGEQDPVEMDPSHGIEGDAAAGPDAAHTSPVEAVSDGHTGTGHADDHPSDHAPATQDEEPAQESAPVAAAAAVASDHRPIWSDHGDAPFDDEPAPTPRYARTPKERTVREKSEKSGGGEFFEILKTVVYALLIALVLRILLFQPFTIPSASMEPNLYEGDYIVVSKWTYGYSKYSSGLPVNIPFIEDRVMGKAPQRGDIVVFKLPRDNKTDYIKRVIGLPGDTVQMISNKLHINGVPVQDAEINRERAQDDYGPRLNIKARETLPNGKSFVTQEWGPGHPYDDTAPFQVPEGYYFMMGDNRDNSVDSREDIGRGVGLVPAENLIGKAEIILFSWEPGASLWNPVSWFAKVRPSRFFQRLE